MAVKSFTVEFEGYWRGSNVSGIPSKSGVYCVYVCTHNRLKGTVTLHQLVYIGESSDVNNRIIGHEKLEDWKKYIKQDQQLCFTFGYVESTYRERVEAALINEHKPPVNTEYKYSFPYDTTTIKTCGRNAKLKSELTVQRR
jgi:predicted GIY-YIG superfamily endonuclease